MQISLTLDSFPLKIMIQSKKYINYGLISPNIIYMVQLLYGPKNAQSTLSRSIFYLIGITKKTA